MVVVGSSARAIATHREGAGQTRRSQPCGIIDLVAVEDQGHAEALGQELGAGNLRARQVDSVWSTTDGVHERLDVRDVVVGYVDLAVYEPKQMKRGQVGEPAAAEIDGRELRPSARVQL